MPIGGDWDLFPCYCGPGPRVPECPLHRHSEGADLISGPVGSFGQFKWVPSMPDYECVL